MSGDINHRLVAHFKDGQISKGYSRDFHPDCDQFHLVLRQRGVAASRVIEIANLKALFHVKTWGRKDRHLGHTAAGFPAGRLRGPVRAIVPRIVRNRDQRAAVGPGATEDLHALEQVA